MSVEDVRRPEPAPSARVERVVEGVAIALIVVVAAVVGLPSLLEMVREGDADLAAVFYPVMLGAVVALAWTRRS